MKVGEIFQKEIEVNRLIRLIFKAFFIFFLCLRTHKARKFIWRVWKQKLLSQEIVEFQLSLAKLPQKTKTFANISPLYLPVDLIN